MKMMAEDIVSVIVSVYMGEQWLERCVSSIQKQTYENIEIILVDDGSPDRSGDICDRLAEADKRIKVIHKANGGLSDARNAGIAAAMGAFIMHVDEDDYIHPHMVEIMHRTMKDTDADIVVCDFLTIPDEVIEFPPVSQKVKQICFEGQDIMNQLWYRNLRTVIVWNKIYKKSIYDAVHYVKGKIHDDESTIHYILDQCKRVVYIEEPLYYYVQREGSITSGKDWRYYADMYEICVERLNFLQDRGYNQMVLFTKLDILHFIATNYRRVKGRKETLEMLESMKKLFAELLGEEEVKNALTLEQRRQYQWFLRSPGWYTARVFMDSIQEKLIDIVKKPFRKVKRAIQKG